MDENPTFNYVDAAEALLVEAVYNPDKDEFIVSSFAMDQFRLWHYKITGRHISRAALQEVTP